MNPNDIQNWVSVKQFQRNIYEFWDKLPIVLTKHGKPFASILPCAGQVKGQNSVGHDGKTDRMGMGTGQPKPVIAFKPIDEAVVEIQKERKLDVCEHGRMKGLCEHGCK